MAETIIEMDYAASQLAFFEEQKKLHEQKLHWWKHQKPYKQYDEWVIYEKCSYHGNAISYLEDAINALKESVTHGMWIPFSDHMWACSNCRVMGSPQWKRCPVCEAKMDGGLPHNVGQATGGAEDA